MTYQFEGVEYALSFNYGVSPHPRFEGAVRLSTMLTIHDKKTGAMRWVTVAYYNPEPGTTFSKELGRQAAIDRIFHQTDMLKDEWILVRRAYYLRKRKKTVEKRQTRGFNRELKKILADADMPTKVRHAASVLAMHQAIKDHGKKARQQTV